MVERPSFFSNSRFEEEKKSSVLGKRSEQDQEPSPRS
jgi:hypothetical protein